MDLGLTAEQDALGDAVRRLLDDLWPPAALRATWEGAEEPAATLWAALGDMGVLGMLAPASLGGLGLGAVELAVVFDELGFAAAPGPVLEHAAAAIPVLAGCGREDLAARAAAGDPVVTFGASGDRVGWPGQAGHLLIARGAILCLVDQGDVTAVSSLDCVDRSRRDAGVGWTGGEPIGSAADLAGALDRASLAAAAQLCGLGRRVVAMTVEYVTARRQFGAPIGSFQAVKHLLADAHLALAHAWPAVVGAAWSVSRDLPTRARDVSMAKAMANEAASLAGRAALQCHGAIGYSWEHDLHLWMKRIWVLSGAWGDTTFHTGRVADAVLGPGPGA